MAPGFRPRAALRLKRHRRPVKPPDDRRPTELSEFAARHLQERFPYRDLAGARAWSEFVMLPTSARSSPAAAHSLRGNGGNPAEIRHKRALLTRDSPAAMNRASRLERSSEFRSPDVPGSTYPKPFAMLYRRALRCAAPGSSHARINRVLRRWSVA